MKLSFQTFCLVFLVTIVHLVVITVFAPVTKSASDFFATLDVETILENGREDFSSLENDESESPEVVLETNDPEVDQEIVSEEEEELASSLLREQPDLEEEELEENPVAAVADPVRGAVTDVRVLSERIQRPELTTLADTSHASLDAGPGPEEKQQLHEKARVEPRTTTSETASASRKLRVREIRPL